MSMQPTPKSFGEVADFCERHLEASRCREIGMTFGAAIQALVARITHEAKPNIGLARDVGHRPIQRPAAADGEVDDVDTVVQRARALGGKLILRKAGVAVGEFERILAGSHVIADRIGDFEFEISANSFFQTNSRGAARLYDTVKDYAGLTGDETVLDLYSGTGTIPILMAADCREVLGIEIVESAVADAQINCRKNGVTNCTLIQGDIRQCLSRIENRPDVLIIDPPRVGMHKDVVRQIHDLGTERIVYVSCNPATLARDIALLGDSYRLLEVQPVDMFPHTFHIEAVASIVKA